MRRIGVLTSGGDCAGLNAAIRAIIKCAHVKYGWEVIGIRHGTKGLLANPMDYQIFDIDNAEQDSYDLLRRGGTILGSITSGNPFAYPMEDGSFQDQSEEIKKNYHKLNLEGLICIGGDGSLKIFHEFSKRTNINIVTIPKTIDNDVGLTESIGYATAAQRATDALDQLVSTAASHDRFMILEVMGRDAGHIALQAGIAGGADVILLPEIPYDINILSQKIKNIIQNGRPYGLIVIAEAARPIGHEAIFIKTAENQKYGGAGNFLSQLLFEKIQLNSRVNVLGHLQRGGTPIAFDRIIASAFGVHAVDLIAGQKFGRMVAWQHGNITDVAIEDALNNSHCVDIQGSLIKTARSLGISFGDL